MLIAQLKLLVALENKQNQNFSLKIERKKDVFFCTITNETNNFNGHKIAIKI